MAISVFPERMNEGRMGAPLPACGPDSVSPIGPPPNARRARPAGTLPGEK